MKLLQCRLENRRRDRSGCVEMRDTGLRIIVVERSSASISIGTSLVVVAMSMIGQLMPMGIPMRDPADYQAEQSHHAEQRDSAMGTESSIASDDRRRHDRSDERSLRARHGVPARALTEHRKGGCGVSDTRRSRRRALGGLLEQPSKQARPLAPEV